MTVTGTGCIAAGRCGSGSFKVKSKKRNGYEVSHDITACQGSGGVMIREMAPDERPREKMMRYGASTLSNPELLAVIMGSGSKGVSSVELASRILAQGGGSGGLGYLRTCIPEELMAAEGVGEAKACQITAAVELGRRIASIRSEDRTRIKDPGDAAHLMMERLRVMRQEGFFTILLNIKNEVISIEQISKGCINSSFADPRDVFEMALKKGAASIILVHNHPSGDPEPSLADREVTERLRGAGELLGIKVLDHIITGDGVYCSMMSENN